MNRWIRRLLVIVGIALAILLLRLTVFRPKAVPVTVVEVARGRVEDTVVNSKAGTLKSRLRAEMSPGIAGLVREVLVKKGEAVRRGQVLLQLDDGEYRAQVDLAARSLDATRAAAAEAALAAEQAGRDRGRAEAMAEDRLISDQVLEQARTRDESATAAAKAAAERVKQAEASLAAARAILEKTIMCAPFDGVVLDISTEVGEWISPSPPGVPIPPVIDVIDPDSLYVSAPLDEVDVARVKVGLPARITMDAFRGQAFPGRLAYVSSYVETAQEQNRTLTVEAVFTEPDLPANVLPGLSADVEVILDAREDVLRVPTYAILEGSRVLVVNGDKLESISVETGLRNWEYTEITSGIDAGDRVVVSLDRAEVKAGARVEVSAGTAS